MAGANHQKRVVLPLTPNRSFISSRRRLKQSGLCNVLRRTIIVTSSQLVDKIASQRDEEGGEENCALDGGA